MSLQVWLPLNGNSNNQGVAAPSFGGSPASWNSAGKLGTSPVFAGNSGHHFTSTFRGCDYVDNFSWTIWVKCTNNSGNTSWAFTNGRADAGEYGWGLQTWNDSVRFWFGTNIWTVSSTLDTWTHFGFTKSGTTIYIYKNGSLYTTATVLTSSYPTFGDGNGIGLGCFYYSGGCIYPFYGELCDFRIYDNCLSAGEIKDISRGLVVHYPMNNGYVEPTTNTMTAINNSLKNAAIGTSSFWSNQAGGTESVIEFAGRKCFKFTYNDQISNRYYVYLTNPAVKATYSCKIWCAASVGSCLHIERYPNYGWGGGSVDYTTPGKWQTISLTLDNAYSDETCYFFVQGNSSNPVYACDFQIETKDHVTPYTPSTRAETSVYDASGHKYNGSITTSTAPICLAGSPRYDKCYKFDGSDDCIKLPAIGLNWNNLSISIWSKWSAFQTWSRSFELADATSGGNNTVGIANSGTSANITVFGRVAGSSSYFPDTTVCAISANTWYHIVVTVDGTALKVYINGQLAKTLTLGATFGNTTMNYGYIAKSNWSGDSYFNGSSSDFRLYTTTLSAEDVLDLYNAPIKIAKSGALITNGEVIE